MEIMWSYPDGFAQDWSSVPADGSTLSAEANVGAIDSSDKPLIYLAAYFICIIYLEYLLTIFFGDFSVKTMILGWNMLFFAG